MLFSLCDTGHHALYCVTSLTGPRVSMRPRQLPPYRGWCVLRRKQVERSKARDGCRLRALLCLQQASLQQASHLLTPRSPTSQVAPLPVASFCKDTWETLRAQAADLGRPLGWSGVGTAWRTKDGAQGLGLAALQCSLEAG